ncbi:helix-turn-helix domain-containing protein [Streptomyces sp. NPDC001586]|uniref:helix-turn-helix domain-containing protein n=1 Tax=Streptomyces sp. NPDC001586 TaxID=3154387 RepID=UPI0033315D8E
MNDVVRTQGTSGEVARGVHPEVAALGNVLTEMFNKLGVSQAAYARRVHLDKSVVSRYFSGKRLATQEFIDRLIHEVGQAARTPVQEHVKEVMRKRRLSALQVIDPAEYELESLRGDLALSRRECERALRQVDGLHLLLEEKEREVRDLSVNISRLQLDWAEERRSTGQEIAHGRQQEPESTAHALMREIEELKLQLAAAQQLHREAESHCEALRMDVISLEEELAAQQPESKAQDVPVGQFIHQITAMLDEQQNVEASKDLSEASWSRPIGEVKELFNWLQKTNYPLGRRFISDVSRFRPLEEVLSFGTSVARIEPSLAADVASELSHRINPENISQVCSAWRDVSVKRDPWNDTVLADLVLDSAIRIQNSHREGVIRLLSAIGSEAQFPTTVYSAGVLSGIAISYKDSWPVIPLSLIHMGWSELAASVIGESFGYHVPEEETLLLSRGLNRMDRESISLLLNFAASVSNRFVNFIVETRPVEPICLPFGDRLMKEAVMSQNFSLVDKFLKAVSEHGSIDVLRTANSGEMLWARYRAL